MKQSHLLGNSQITCDDSKVAQTHSEMETQTLASDDEIAEAEFVANIFRSSDDSDSDSQSDSCESSACDSIVFAID